MKRCGWARPGRKMRRSGGRVGLALLAAAVVLLGSCASSKPKPRPVRPTLPPIDAPNALRGTLKTQADLVGVEPILVSGIGFVVGLRGTGGQVLDERVATTLERDMGLMGVGRPGLWENTPFEGATPRQVLADPNTAAVLVTAAIPPGAPVGSRFDVFVRAFNASSLEGGRLFTTDLRIGRPATFGAATARKLAEARGDVFINPFSEPGAEGTEVGRDVGRILSGGVVTDSLRIEVRMRTPSHGRVRLVASAINSRFPQREGDREPIARGVDENSVSVTVPARFQDDAGDFVELLRHVQLDTAFPQVHAQRYITEIEQEPYLAGDLSWALQALGEPALPFIRQLYDHPEVAPRLAGLRAGAGLSDPQAAPMLRQLAETGPISLRPDAIRLLGRLNAGPTVDLTLRTLLQEEELTIRIAAYEALADRAERAQRRRLLIDERSRDVAPGQQLSVSQLDLLSKVRLPPGTLQGVSRLTVPGKFHLDRVPFGAPMVYVTQQGTPRIVLFGEDIRLRQPAFVSAWSNRLLVSCEGVEAPVRVRYETLPVQNPREPDVPRAQVYTQEIDASAAKFIDLLSHDTTPEQPQPGFGMSYVEVVGALHAVWQQGALVGSFATERDKLAAELLAALDREPVLLRPEKEGDTSEVVVLDEAFGAPKPSQTPPPLGPDGKPTLVVPIDRTPNKEKNSK